MLWDISFRQDLISNLYALAIIICIWPIELLNSFLLAPFSSFCFNKIYWRKKPISVKKLSALFAVNRIVYKFLSWKDMVVFKMFHSFHYLKTDLICKIWLVNYRNLLKESYLLEKFHSVHFYCKEIYLVVQNGIIEYLTQWWMKALETSSDILKGVCAGIYLNLFYKSLQ